MSASLPSVALGFVAGVLATTAIGFFTRTASVEEREQVQQVAEAPDDDTGRVVANASTETPLRAEVAQLKAELANERRRHEQDSKGEPVPFPAQIAERHTEKGLMAAVQAALVELDLRGEVETMDCTENPCLAQVRVLGSVDYSRFRKASALADYAKDKLSFSNGSLPGGEEVLIIGFREQTPPDVAADDPEREQKLEELHKKHLAENHRRAARENDLLQSALEDRRNRSPEVE